MADQLEKRTDFTGAEYYVGSIHGESAKLEKRTDMFGNESYYGNVGQSTVNVTKGHDILGHDVYSVEGGAYDDSDAEIGGASSGSIFDNLFLVFSFFRLIFYAGGVIAWPLLFISPPWTEPAYYIFLVAVIALSALLATLWMRKSIRRQDDPTFKQGFLHGAIYAVLLMPGMIFLLNLVTGSSTLFAVTGFWDYPMMGFIASCYALAPSMLGVFIVRKTVKP